jgi:hypothetical protein
MDWMPGPWSTLFFVYTDGGMSGCTYMPEQEVIGWHRHDTGANEYGEIGDKVLDVVCLPGGDQTETFFLVERTINGETRRYIEQLAPDYVADNKDWHYVDSGLVFDGRNNTAETVTATTQSGGYSDEDTVTLLASGALFVGASDVGDAIWLDRTIPVTDPDTGIVSDKTYGCGFRITSVVDSTHALAMPNSEVPEALRAQATKDWTFRRNTISGLDHLEGREVAILSDADKHRRLVVTGGSITLDQPGGVVHVGLPYRAHIETLEVNNPGGPGVRDAKKLLTSIGLLVQDTRGIKACGGELRDEYTYELAQRESEAWGESTRTLTGYAEIPVSAEWGENNGHGHILSDDPLPMTILAVVPRVMVSDRVA